MFNEEKFKEFVQKCIAEEYVGDEKESAEKHFSKMVKTYISTSKSVITDKGRDILIYMTETPDEYELGFKSKEIGVGLDVSSRSIAGTMRKLVLDGYVLKDNSTPEKYTITEKYLKEGEN